MVSLTFVIALWTVQEERLNYNLFFALDNMKENMLKQIFNLFNNLTISVTRVLEYLFNI